MNSSRRKKVTNSYKNIKINFDREKGASLVRSIWNVKIEHKSMQTKPLQHDIHFQMNHLKVR